MLSLFIPWLLFVLLVVIVIFLFKKKWKATIALAVIVITLNCWGECFPFRLFPISRGGGNTLKVLAFNAEGSGEDTKIKGRSILRLVKEANPDVIFLSEFFGRDAYFLDSLLRTVFPYTTYPQFGTPHYFYSKYPLINSRRINIDNSYEPGIFCCDMIFVSDTINLYGCHLASNNYDNDERHSIVDSISSLSDVFDYIYNINSSSRKRYDNVKLLTNEINEPLKALIMGDMNDVGGSSSIKEIESAGFADCWWEGGVGYGATIHRPLPYRIDHIMHSDGLKLNCIKIVESKGISDHDGLYAEFSIKR